MNRFMFLSIFSSLCLSFVLSSCSAQPSQSQPTYTKPDFSTSTPTFYLTKTLSPIPTATAEILDSPTTRSNEFCLDYVMPWSCACGNLSSELIEIRKADDLGSCEIKVPFGESSAVNGFRIKLPDTWYCRIAGAAAGNLSCVTENGQSLFIQTVVSDLSVEDTDKAIQTFCEGDGCFSNPLVATDEDEVERAVMMIGDIQTVKLITQQKDTIVLRYFVKNEDNLYVFIVSSKDTAEIKGMTGLLEETIGTMQFIQ